MSDFPSADSYTDIEELFTHLDEYTTESVQNNDDIHKELLDARYNLEKSIEADTDRKQQQFIQQSIQSLTLARKFDKVNTNDHRNLQSVIDFLKTQLD